MNEQGHSQYAAASGVPLIKSPSLRVPPPIALPPDIHPLPESVTAYFVYPFTLEPHILTLEGARQSTLAAHASKREACLRARENDKEKRKRDALRRIAPGFEPQGVPLVPVRVERPLADVPQRTSNLNGASNESRSIMDELVDQLAAMDARPGISTTRSNNGQPSSTALPHLPPSFSDLHF